MDLLPKIEGAWVKKGTRLRVPTLGYTKRRNFFVTLLWPSKRIIWNSFERRRNQEFRLHLSNVLAHARRHGLKKVVLFIDHASYHKTPEVQRFFSKHSVFKRKFLGLKDPNSNPVERLVNKRLNSAVCVNYCHDSLDALTKETKSFLRKYNLTYAT